MHLLTLNCKFYKWLFWCVISYEKHLDSIFRIAHTGNLQKKIHALNLLFQILTNMNNFHERYPYFTNNINDYFRYYRALYEVLFSSELKSSPKLTNFFNLLYRSFKFDMKIERVHAFVKRICQISLYQEPNFICAALYLISEVCSMSYWQHFFRPSSSNQESNPFWTKLKVSNMTSILKSLKNTILWNENPFLPTLSSRVDGSWMNWPLIIILL